LRRLDFFQANLEVPGLFGLFGVVLVHLIFLLEEFPDEFPGSSSRPWKGFAGVGEGERRGALEALSPL
jgi:hypothetical protein